MLFGAIIAILLFLGSGWGLVILFFGEFSRNDFDRVTIQKTVRVEANCPAERVAASYIINADRNQGYIAVLFQGIGEPGRIFPFNDCERIWVTTYDIDHGKLSSAYFHRFDQKMPPKEIAENSVKWSKPNNGIVIIDPKSVDPRYPSFSFHIPIDNLLTRNGADTWTMDLQVVSVFPNSDVVPNGVLTSSIRVFTDPDLIIDSLEPALIGRPPTTEVPQITLTKNFEDRVVKGNDQYLLGEDSENQLNKINNERIRLTLRDPNYSTRRDAGILVLSTLFGIGVTLLFETILILSVRQSLGGAVGKVENRATPKIQTAEILTSRKGLKMSHPDLPAPVKAMLADEGHRVHHHLWHFVRNEQSWNNLPQADRDQLTADGWAAPRFDQQPGSGIDFLGMHRQMITMTNNALAAAGDPNWPSVTAWDPIPFEDDHTQWPVPDWQPAPPPWSNPTQWQRFTDFATRARSGARVEEMKELAGLFRDPAHLTTVTLDELGIQMEWSIHGWMHMRWSGTPADDAFAVGPDNDWLFLPWSSHVNETFWKLHGWIDARITDWEEANNQTADLSQAWSGPMPAAGGMMHMAEARLLKHLPPREESPMPMSVKEPIIEGLLGKVRSKKQ